MREGMALEIKFWGGNYNSLVRVGKND